MRKSLSTKLWKLAVAVAVPFCFIALLAPTAHADSLTYTFTLCDSPYEQATLVSPTGFVSYDELYPLTTSTIPGATGVDFVDYDAIEMFLVIDGLADNVGSFTDKQLHTIDVLSVSFGASVLIQPTPTGPPVSTPEPGVGLDLMAGIGLLGLVTRKSLVKGLQQAT